MASDVPFNGRSQWLSDEEKWLRALEECETAIENFRTNIGILSEVSESVRQNRQELFQRLKRGVGLINDSKRLLALVDQMRKNTHAAEVQISRLGEMVSVESMVIANQENGKK